MTPAAPAAASALSPDAARIPLARRRRPAVPTTNPATDPAWAQVPGSPFWNRPTLHHVDRPRGRARPPRRRERGRAEILTDRCAGRGSLIARAREAQLLAEKRRQTPHVDTPGPWAAATRAYLRLEAEDWAAQRTLVLLAREHVARLARQTVAPPDPATDPDYDPVADHLPAEQPGAPDDRTNSRPPPELLALVEAVLTAAPPIGTRTMHPA